MAASSPGWRRTKLEDRAWASGGHVSIPTKGAVPRGQRVLGIELYLDATITQPAAAAAAQLGAVLHQAVAKIQIGRRIDIDGLGAHLLGWQRRGRELDFPAGFPAGVSTVFSRKIGWAIDYADYTARDGAVNDGALPAELFAADEIEIDFSTEAAMFAAAVPTIAGTLRTYVVHDSSRGGRLGPTSRLIRSEPFAALSAHVQKRGRFEHAILYRLAANDAGGVTSVQVSNVLVDVGGEPVVRGARVQDLASSFNRTRAVGPNRRLESQTAPISGEAIESQPGAAAAAGLGVTCDFVSLLIPPMKHLPGSQAPRSEGGNDGLNVTLTGSITTYRIAYVLVEPRSIDSEAKASVAQGAPNADTFLKTASKDVAEDPDIREFVPVRFRKR